MQIIQMWRSFEYPLLLIDCLSSVIKLVGQKNYTIICNNPEIPRILGVESKNFDDEYLVILNQMKDKTWWKSYCTLNMYMADMMRIYYATQIPDLLYLDADIMMYRKPIFDKLGKPYFLERDIRMFYVNGMTEWFKKILNDITDKLSPSPYVIYKYVNDRLFANPESFRIDGKNLYITDFGKRYKI